MTPSRGAIISISIFIASNIEITWPASTFCPTSTKIFQTLPFTVAPTSVPEPDVATGATACVGVAVATGATTWISTSPCAT